MCLPFCSLKDVLGCFGSAVLPKEASLAFCLPSPHVYLPCDEQEMERKGRCQAGLWGEQWGSGVLAPADGSPLQQGVFKGGDQYGHSRWSPHG